jgi:hypothetical protein
MGAGQPPGQHGTDQRRDEHHGHRRAEPVPRAIRLITDCTPVSVVPRSRTTSDNATLIAVVSYATTIC